MTVGWGEQHNPPPDEQYGVGRAGHDLADTVERWLRERSTGNEERVAAALARYRQAAGRTDL